MKEKYYVERRIAYMGVLAVVCYVLHIILGQASYPNYNWMRQAVSDLTAIGSPSRPIASVFATAYGILAVIFSMSFHDCFVGRISKTFSKGTFLFAFMNVVSAIGYFLFPLGSNNDTMHLIITGAVVALTIASLVMIAIGSRRQSQLGPLSLVCVLVLLILSIGGVATGIVQADYFGLAERINAFTTVSFIIVLAVTLIQYKQKAHI